VVTGKKESYLIGNIKVYDYLLTDELEQVISKSEVVLCRSGYSTIMDLSVMNKKVFFIPTKGQFEQEYLAKYLNERFYIPFLSEEEDFTKINVSLAKELPNTKRSFPEDLFSLF